MKKFAITVGIIVVAGCTAQKHEHKKYIPYSNDGHRIVVYDHCECGYGVYLHKKCTFCGKKK